MASHKNQHYVPRCYLKPFTIGSQGLAINLFNIDRRCGISNAPIKGQCSSNYFYGEDLTLEHLLQKEEGIYSQVLTSLCKPNFQLDEIIKHALRHFCFLQYCRTDAAARRLTESMSEFAEIAEVPPRISMRETVQIAMHTFATSMEVVNDLKVCLVRNRTCRPFITSDDPAVLTNRWYSQNPKAAGLSYGVEKAGALFFLPLTPQALCVIYDGDVYSMPSDGGWMNVNRVADIDAFNQYQFLNCRSNVYFHDWRDMEAVAQAFELSVKHRPSARYEVITAVLDREDQWGKNYRVVSGNKIPQSSDVLIHTKSIHPKPTQWPMVIKFRDKPKIYSNGSGTGFLRRSRAERGFGYQRVR